MTSRTLLICTSLLLSCASHKPAQVPAEHPAVTQAAPAPEPQPDGKPRAVIRSNPMSDGWIGFSEPIAPDSPMLANLHWVHKEMKSEIGIAAYAMSASKIEHATWLMRQGMADGRTALSPVTVAEDGKRAWFRLELEIRGRRISGKTVVCLVRDDPSIIAVLIGEWPPEYDKQLSQEIDLMADNTTVTVY